MLNHSLPGAVSDRCLPCRGLTGDEEDHSDEGFTLSPIPKSKDSPSTAAVANDDDDDHVTTSLDESFLSKVRTDSGDN